jgi:hypothetical protein
LNQDAGGGLLFFFNGEVIGGSSARGEGHLDRSVAYRDDMIARSRQFGGVFNVSRIQLKNISTIQMPAPKAAPSKSEKPTPRPAQAKAPPAKGAGSAAPGADSRRILDMLQMLLVLLERVIKSNRKLKVDFETFLNKKFVEKADKYEFLDPFAGEFRYANGQIFYSGKADNETLVKAIVECVKEIVVSLGIIGIFGKYLESWRKGFSSEIMDFDIEI